MAAKVCWRGVGLVALVQPSAHDSPNVFHYVRLPKVCRLAELELQPLNAMLVKHFNGTGFCVKGCAVVPVLLRECPFIPIDQSCVSFALHLLDPLWTDQAAWSNGCPNEAPRSLVWYIMN